MDDKSGLPTVPEPQPPSSYGSPSGLGMSGFGSLSRGPMVASPFLDFDPSIINPGTNDSQWIFPDGATNRHSRGRFELAFSQIGGSVMIGGALGGVMGGVNGLKTTTGLENASFAVKRSQLINYVTKNGANTANTFGTIAVIYSAIGVALSFINESNDELNTFISAGSTGLLYGALSSPKITPNATSVLQRLTPVQARIKRSVIGTVVGLAISSAYVFFMRDGSRGRR